MKLEFFNNLQIKIKKEKRLYLKEKLNKLKINKEVLDNSLNDVKITVDRNWRKKRKTKEVNVDTVNDFEVDSESETVAVKSYTNQILTNN